MPLLSAPAESTLLPPNLPSHYFTCPDGCFWTERALIEPRQVPLTRLIDLLHYIQTTQCSKKKKKLEHTSFINEIKKKSHA